MFRFARRFPQVCCQNETELLRDLLDDRTVEREQHIAYGDHVSSYRIRPSQAAADTLPMNS